MYFLCCACFGFFCVPLSGGAGPRAGGTGADLTWWQGAWAHRTPQERILFCEVGDARAVSTSRYRLLYAPRIKPIAKGGTRQTQGSTIISPTSNTRLTGGHCSYWRPASRWRRATQFDGPRRDNLSGTELLNLRAEITRLQVEEAAQPP